MEILVRNGLKRSVTDRQHEYDAKDVRDASISTEAIHLASAQEYSKAGLFGPK